MEYKITKEQLDQIANLLGECPGKFVVPIIDLLREIATNQKIDEKPVNGEK